MTRTLRPAAGLIGVSALALGLSACKIDNRPLLARNEPLPAANAYAAVTPGPLDPGYGEPVAYLPAESAYAYPERAYAVSRTAYRRPPSYAFAYDDEQPWAWEVADEGLMFAEPYEDSWRYYYYEPGEAYPYYVQDADYAYAYGDNGALIALFTAAGALISADRYRDYAPRASYYWTRAHDLNRSYWRSPRYPVEERVWRTRSAAIFAPQERWSRAFEAQPAWRLAGRHDNGRHLGWYKDRGDRWDHGDRGDRGERRVALAAPPRLERPARLEREIRREPRAEVRQDHPRPFREARVAEARREAPRPQDAHGGKAWREARAPVQARGAQAQGRDAAFHGGGNPKAKAAPQNGGGQGENHGGGKGGHGKGKER